MLQMSEDVADVTDVRGCQRMSQMLEILQMSEDVQDITKLETLQMLGDVSDIYI